MRVTDELLQVARAVRDAMVAEANDVHQFEQTCAGSLEMIDLHALIAALPEAAPLPAPTGPVAVWLVEFKHALGWTPIHEAFETKEAATSGLRKMRERCPNFEYRVVQYGPLAEPTKEG